MTWGLAILIGIIWACWLSWFMRTYPKGKPDKPDASKWQELPSGWFKDFRNLTLFASDSTGESFWWICRDGTTIIMGKAQNVKVAMREVEREARDLADPA